MAFCIDLITRKLEGCIRILDKSIRRSPAWEKGHGAGFCGPDPTGVRPSSRHRVVAGLGGQKRSRIFSSLAPGVAEMDGNGAQANPRALADDGLADPRFVKFPATGTRHRVNALLNYTYAVRESQIRIQVVSIGFDPVQGIMHVRARRDPGGHRPGRGDGAVRRRVRPGTDSVVSSSGRGA